MNSDILKGNLRMLADVYGEAKGLQPSTIGKMAISDGQFFARIEDPTKSFTVRKYDQIVSWFEANWPDDVQWPPVVERKSPSTEPDLSFAKALGDRISKARFCLNMVQPDLAALCGVSRQAVSQWENGMHTPRIEQLPTLAKALSVSIDYLLTGRRTATREKTAGDAAAHVDLLPFLHYVRAEYGIDVPERHFEMLRALRSPAPSIKGVDKTDTAAEESE